MEITSTDAQRQSPVNSLDWLAEDDLVPTGWIDGKTPVPQPKSATGANAAEVIAAHQRSLGFVVFPCYGPGPKFKRPRVKWQDPEPVGGWKFEPNDLVAVRLPVGYAVLDIDDAALFAASGLAEQLPDNLVSSETRRPGGRHIFFSTDGRPVPQIVDKNDLGYDTRVGGLGYVIVWNAKSWEPVTKWPAAPEFMYHKPTGTPVGGTSPYIALKTALGALDGPLVTNDDVFRALCAIQGRVKLDIEVLVAQCIAWLASGKIETRDEPWQESDFRTIATSVSKYEPRTTQTASGHTYDDLNPRDAERAGFLAGQFDHEIRYDAAHENWHQFKTPGIWFPDRTNDVQRQVKEYAREALAQQVGHPNPDPTAAKIARQFYSGLEDVQTTNSALIALSEFTDYKTTGDDWDLDPDLLGCENGILNLAIGELVENPGPELLVTRSTGINFNPAAVCPQFDTFLDQITADQDNNPRPELANYILDVFGAALFGHVKPQQFWLFIGLGGAGKGTLCKIIGHVLGVNQYSGSPERTLYSKSHWGDPASDKPRADFLQLQGMRMIYINEPPAPLNDKLLESHSGDDPIDARALNSNNYVHFRPTHTTILISNITLRVEDVGVSMKRRLRVVPFDRSFADHPDVTLEDRLKTESEGILALLARHALGYYADPAILDLDRAPAIIREESQEYLDESDPLAAFYEDYCVLRVGLRTETNTLYTAYNSWYGLGAGTGDNDQLARREFGTALKTRNFKSKKSNGQRFWTGIGLRTAPEQTEMTGFQV